MKRFSLLVIVLLLTCFSLRAQTELSSILFGVRFGHSFGFEMGATFNDRWGFKLASDGTMPQREPDDSIGYDETFEKQFGKRYHLLYGGSLMYHVTGPVWVDMDLGYAWSGRLAWDTMNQRLGTVKSVRGLSMGMGLHCMLGSGWYAILGYNGILKGFSKNRPDHNWYLGIGINVPIMP